MNPGYAQSYRDLYEKHWWWRTRESTLSEALGRVLVGKPGSYKILDIGCGDRLSFGFLSKWGKVQGVEPDRSLLSDQSLTDPNLYVGPWDDRQPFQGPFDLVTALDVIEHIEKDQEAVKRMADLLKPGGVLLIHVPASPSLWTRHDEINQHHRRYTPRELRGLIEVSGLEVLEMRGCFWFTVPIKWLQSKFERNFPKCAHHPGVPKIPSLWINRVLMAWCRFENFLGRFLRFDFGSSLLLLARRSPTRPQLDSQ